MWPTMCWLHPQKASWSLVCKPWEFASVCLVAKILKLTLAATLTPYLPCQYSCCRPKMPSCSLCNNSRSKPDALETAGQRDDLQNLAPILHTCHSQRNWSSYQKHTLAPNCFKHCQRCCHKAWKGPAKFQDLGQKVQNWRIFAHKLKTEVKMGYISELFPCQSSHSATLR